VALKLLQGAGGILGASLPEGGREMPVLVLLDPALGASAALLQRALGPGFSVVVGAPPAGMAPPARYVVVTTAADAAMVAQVRQAFAGADLLVVAGGAAPEHDPGRAAAFFTAGADTIVTSMSVPELAAHLQAHARRFTAGDTGPPPQPRPRAAARPSGRDQVVARLAGAKRRLAVAAVAGFTALAGTVAWAGARGSDTAGATTTDSGGDGGVTRQLTPQGPDRFFDGRGGGGSFGDGGDGGQGGPAAGSSGAS
jgi:hypothetical protein